MRIITGDECGLLKECTLPKNVKINNPDDLQEKSRNEGHARKLTDSQIQSRASGGVVSLTPLPGDSGDSDNGDDDENKPFLSFLAFRSNGIVETWEGRRNHDKPEEAEDKSSTNTVTKPPSKPSASYQKLNSTSDIFKDVNNNDQNATSAKPIGIAVTNAGDDSKKTIMVGCNSAGQVHVLNNSSGANNASASPYSVVARYNYAKGNSVSTTIKNVSPDQNILSAFAFRGNRIALGGRDRETVLMDLETGETVWKAKNLPPDRRTLLQEPIWSTAIKFLDLDEAHLPHPLGSKPSTDGNNNDNANCNIIAVGSAHKQLRIYDIRVQRRPAIYTPSFDSGNAIFNHCATALCQLSSNQVAVGDTAGDIYKIDLRKMNQIMGRYSGPAGSVRDIGVYSDENYKQVLTSVGLDRMVWAWDARSLRCLGNVYMKQRLNCLMFCDYDDYDENFREEKEEKKGDEEELMQTSLEYGGDIEEEDAVHDYIDSDDEEDAAMVVEDDDDGSGSEEEDKTGKSSDSDASSSETGSDSSSGVSSSSEEEDDDEENYTAALSKKRRT